MFKLYLFDWDGTLAVPESGATFRKSGEKYKWLADPDPLGSERLHSSRKELLEHLYFIEPCHFAIHVNQGGIAYGIIRQDETEEAIHALLKDLPFPIPFLVCPFHEAKYPLYEEYAGWRKPLPGMLLALASLFPAVKPEEILVIGDRPEDEDAARAAGFAYDDAEAFFSRVELDLEAFIHDALTAGEVQEDAHTITVMGDEDD